MKLRVTRRALEDLGIKPELAGSAAEFLEDKHEVVKAFVKVRSQSPSGQEATKLPVTKTPVWNLHAGRWRALTWHDAQEDVVWLLGAGWHESGSIDDAYAVLKRRDQAGDLFPTIDDYLDLEPSPDQFVDELARRNEALRNAALSCPDQVVEATLCDTLNVRLLTREGHFYLGLTMPPLQPGVLPNDWLEAAAAAFMCSVPEESLDWAADFPIWKDLGRGRHEIVLAAPLTSFEVD